MIPLPALSAIPWKAIGYGVAIGALLLLGWRVHAWREGYLALPAAQEALQNEQACGEGSECLKRSAALQAAHKLISEQVERDYEQKLADIAARPVPREPVRLCRPARTGDVRVPSATAATGPSQGAELPPEIGRDIAVELYGLADDADREALKLELLYGRDVALSQKPR